jgi:hypothetical protein
MTKLPKIIYSGFAIFFLEASLFTGFDDDLLLFDAFCWAFGSAPIDNKSFRSSVKNAVPFGFTF